VVQRKNPLGTVRAFRRAFPTGAEKAILVLKTRNTQTFFSPRDKRHWEDVQREAEADPRIYIINATFTDQELVALKACCDCFVSLHRSEGFGFGPAEAMALGKPVIVTDYSGVCDFCNSENALLVDYELSILERDEYPYIDASRSYYWSTPNIQTASRHMRQLFENPDLARALGAAGQRTIATQYSVEALRARYHRRLMELSFLNQPEA
jgi:glycosyltransferase involved in cell wall biosynthesis